jgi:trehalose 6-phosphate phosphatase
MTERSPKHITSSDDIDELRRARKIWLFLDYDGTLAEFAPTPDDILPDQELIDILTQLANIPELRVSIVSGRRLSHIQSLLPVPGVLLAGSYGVEMQTEEGDEVYQVKYDEIRPALEAVKPKWQSLLDGKKGFYLEDKGWTLAIHAKDAEEEEAESVLSSAVPEAEETASLEPFRVIGGLKFIEIGPHLANKGFTIDFLLEEFPWKNAELVYIGDDDKDEDAFEVIKEHGGITIVVAKVPRPTKADYRLESPKAVRTWLSGLRKKYQAGMEKPE